eukprot:387981_1
MLSNRADATPDDEFLTGRQLITSKGYPLEEHYATPDDEFLTGRQLITSKGYPLEEHYATTTDGFILRIFRIPHGRNSSLQRKGAVLLQHGLLDSSDTWVLNDADKSLSFILADNGYDVWMGNNRGNFYSRNHTSLDPDAKNGEFWKWSFDEMGLFDIPAMVGYIKTATGREKIAYVGHSEGCTQMYVNLATPASVQSSISLFVALAPALDVHTTTSILPRTLAKFRIAKLAEFLGTHEFLPHYALFRILNPMLCVEEPKLCKTALFLIADFQPQNYDMSRVPVYVSHYTAGTSVQNMAHWAESVRRDGFHFFGPHASEIPVGQLPFPPTVVFSGGKDSLATPADVEWSTNLISNNVRASHFLPEYDHLAFVWGNEANSLIYEKILDELEV